MTVNDIKIYLEERPFPIVIPNDQQLEKYFNFAKLILKVFYQLTDDQFTEQLIEPVGEEVAYLIDNNPFEDIYKQYNYLKSFTIGNGAVKGEVFEKTIGLLGNFVKNLMAALGYQMIQTDTGKAYYSYAIY